MFRKFVVLFFITNFANCEENVAYETGMSALGGALIGFTGQGYPGAIVGGVGQMMHYLLFEQGKTSDLNSYLKTDTTIKIAYRIDSYRIKNPYNNETVWVGSLKNGEAFRDTEGRLMIIEKK
jgi:hypothetical protein